MKNKLIILVVSLVMTLSFSFPVFASNGTAAGPDYGPNAKAAISEFGIDENCVEIASKNDTVSTLNEMIKGIAPDASESNPGMVYVPEGTFNVSSTLKVLPNVVLVSESGVVFKSTSSANMVKLSGLFTEEYLTNSQDQGISFCMITERSKERTGSLRKLI